MSKACDYEIKVPSLMVLLIKKETTSCRVAASGKITYWKRVAG